ncbi:DegT/DnrJ/EryC1/StrS family aminotransferase [Sphingomonas faeni]|uniref:DegT/DnrJ/EryC1/StrS family aminotransferase n=1 Tax=Sphingomonas faeni TaxID=185950 RepID=UPI002788547A|nr:DegT/DnrJ/EryC1/StrS family aminotransferase [Sphingomonas faeni]MDQ0839819.1 dTDP-4-amino-4,6-dideoxygalactose transaminase [Sphingomonas faeni]
MNKPFVRHLGGPIPHRELHPLNPIYVTRPYLPPLEEFLPFLEKIWETRVLTNNGPFHQELESQLTGVFDSQYVSLTSNGMLALTAAIDAAKLTGEVITTPYSFVATTHALALQGLEPVFVDVRSHDLNIDPDAIEAAITPRTSAIMAVHVYGNPCAVEAIEEIAKRHDLIIIYDAAHAFGVRYKGRSLLSYGDFAALSFHATKAFNTFEGGAVVSNSEDRKLAVNSARNFGIADEVNIPSLGTNAKMSEINAAFGIVQLKHFEQVRRERRAIDTLYREMLGGVTGIDLIDIPEDVEPNYSYFPILVNEHFPMSRDMLYGVLKEQNIFSRRYFFPLLSSLPMYEHLPSAALGLLPIAERAARQVLSLPIYPDLSNEDQLRICDAILMHSR